MFNVNQITSQLAKMPDQALQQYAAMHKNDPYTVALALAESNRHKDMRAGAAPQTGQMPKVVDQDIAQMMAPPPQQIMPPQARPQMPPQQAQQQLPENTGIGQLPAQNMQGMADGGIVGYADTGLVQEQLPGGLGILSQGSFGPQAGNVALEKRIAAIQSNPRMRAEDKANLIAQIKQEFFKVPEPATAMYTNTGATTTVPPATTPIVTPPTTYPAKEKLPEGAKTPAQIEVETNARKDLTREEKDNIINSYKNGYKQFEQLGSIKTATTATPAATSTAPAGGGITALPSEADAIKRFKENINTTAEPTVDKDAFLKELGDISKPAYDKANTLIETEKNRLKEGKEQDFYMSLIQGGLAAAGESGPNALQNIAKGFEKGAANYAASLKDFRKAAQENAKMEVDIERAKAADKKGDVKSFYEHQEKAYDRKAKVDDRIAAGISSIINTTEHGKYSLAAAETSGKYQVSAAGINANAQQNLMTELGKADENSPLRKGFELQKTMAQQAALYEQYQKLLIDPTTGMMRPDVKALYPDFKTYLSEYEKAIASKGTTGGGIKNIPDPSKVQQPVLQR